MYNPNFYAPLASPMLYAKGGSVNHGLAAAAEQLRQRGRGGDTILAHINPEEAGILKLLGGRGTINPRTGLPEFDWWSKNVTRPVGGALKSAGSAIDDAIIQPVLGAANDVAEALGPIGAIAAAYFGGPLGAAIYGGFQAPGDDFNVKRAALSGALAYGAGELMGGGGAGGAEGAGGISGIEGFAADPVAAAGGFGDAVSSGIPIGSPEAFIQNIPAAANTGASAAGGFGGASGAANLPSLPDMSALAEPTASYMPASANISGAEASNIMGGGGGDIGGGFDANYAIPNASPATSPGASIIDRSVAFDPNAYGAISPQSGLGSIAGAVGEIGATQAGKALDYALANPIQTALGATTAYGAYEGKKEQDKYNEEIERQQEAIEGKKTRDREFAENVLTEYPLRFGGPSEEDVRRLGLAGGGAIQPHDSEYGSDDQMATGGLMGLARGGMPPRFLSGGGDGMSDSIHANIEGRQEARLADGEFVIPADVVSHIGNGSSKAGAKKLYAMMDRVREARTGKERQAPQINARRMMPA